MARHFAKSSASAFASLFGQVLLSDKEQRDNVNGSFNRTTPARNAAN